MKTLLNSVTSDITSLPLYISPQRQRLGGAVPFQIFGIINANVIFEGTLVSDISDLPTANWSPIANAVFSQDTCDGLFVMFNHIRAKVFNYTSGSITVTLDT